jgi:DNA-directed RNA polymerase subunit M/transcription elongation factor TFIIS
MINVRPLKKFDFLYCPDCLKKHHRRDGVLWTVEQSKLADALNMQTYQCHKCGHKFIHHVQKDD